MTAGTADAALRISGLNVSYGAMPAVRDVDLVVGRGEAVAVIGSNGAGKSSMLRGIMGLAPASATRIEVDGRPIAGMPTHGLPELGLGYVPEGRELFPGLTVKEELLIGGRGLPRAKRDRKLDEIYALFPRLKERQSQITRTLSGGEQQMLAIARILMRTPKLLLLDEPSLGLAPVMQDVVYAALKGLRDAGMSILLVEQNAFRALNLCHRSYVLALGQITREGSSRDLLEDPEIRGAYLGK